MHLNYTDDVDNLFSSQKETRIFSEDFMQANVGKKVTVYTTYDGSAEWRDKIFIGTLAAVGRDFIVIREDKSRKEVLLYNINVDFVYFDEAAFIPKR
ncbi:MAG: hypothetical protein RLZ12_520 [Bacillota bacterium]|jgi:spore coat protein GerQ